MMLRSEQSDEINPVSESYSKTKTPLDHFVTAKIKNGSHVTNHGTVRTESEHQKISSPTTTSTNS
jgi:hypothetical protein